MSLALKILIVVAVIVLLFRGPSLLKQLTKLAQSAGRDRSGPPDSREDRDGKGKATATDAAMDLAACPVCGVYSNLRCERWDCPRPPPK